MAKDDGQTTKRQRTTEEHAASKAASGYFASDSANTDSNATSSSEPRIVLGESFGKDAKAAGGNAYPVATADENDAFMSLDGCANRYVGKVVVVTGGSKGIGEGCVRAFFAAGANVVFCSRGQGEGEALRDSLNAAAPCGNSTYFVKVDVSKVDQVVGLVEAAVAQYGRLDCLINNAGWHPPPKTIDDFSVEEMQDLFQLNFVSIFAACKAALPHLRKTKGNIINMSSFVGACGQAEAPTYTATKGAITSFSKGLAIDEAKTGVRVNIISPGNIWTPLWKSWSDGEADPTAAKEAGDRVQVMARKGTIIETGRLALCIAADMTFTTGVDHIQSGGAELGYGIKA